MLRSLAIPFIIALFAAAAGSAGCASTADDGNAEAVDDSADALSARTPVSLASLQDQSWATTSAVARDGEIVELRLYGDGSYVRLRCYGAGCANPVAETDRFDAFRSRGKTYIEFKSFVRVLVPPPAAKNPPPPGVPAKPSAPEWQNQPVVADTYELKTTPSGIKLRKTYSAHWTTLGTIDDPSLCAASGGTWSPPAVTPPSTTPKVPPTTKGQQPATPPPAGGAPAAASPAPPVVDAWNACHCAAGEGYVAGGGGCQHIAVSTESACDDTNGSYTDDDSTRLGTYCACGLGRTMTDTGCITL